MSYEDHFKLADEYLTHLDEAMDAIADPFIEGRYLGFVAVSAVTAFELAIKEIYQDFASKKHKVFGAYVNATTNRLNGRITTKDIREHISKFGDKYAERFKTRSQMLDRDWLKAGRGSVLSSYGNLITWRHKFVHTGKPPPTTNYEEVKKSYQTGKALIGCLAGCMTR